MKLYQIRSLIPWHRGNETISLVAVPTGYLKKEDTRVIYAEQHMTIKKEKTPFLVRSQVDKYTNVSFSLSYYRWQPDQKEEWVELRSDLFNNSRPFQCPANMEHEFCVNIAYRVMKNYDIQGIIKEKSLTSKSKG